MEYWSLVSVIVFVRLYLILIKQNIPTEISHHQSFASVTHSISWTYLEHCPQWSAVQIVTRLHE